MSNTFDLDFQDEESLNNSSTLNKRFQETVQAKVGVSTYTKGFFQVDQDNDYDLNDSPQNEEKNKKASETGRKHRGRKRNTKLEPLKQQEKVSVFENANRDNEEVLSEQQEKVEQRQKVESVLKTEVKQEPLIKHSQNTFVFKEQPEEGARQLSQGSNSDQPERPTSNENNYLRQEVLIAQNRQFEHDFQDDDDQVEPVPEINIAKSNIFNYQSTEEMKRQLVEPINPGQMLRMELIRDKSGFNTFWPQFHVHFQQNSHYLMSAKKTGSKPYSTFVMSSNKSNFEQTSEFYLGKMKSNVLGDHLNIFGPGLNPSNARDKNQVPRELLATVVYKSHLFEMGKPRQFTIYLKKPEVRYYNSFSNVKMYDEEVPLSVLYNYPENRSKIIVFQNKKPKWIEELSGYMLNFKGRVEKPSIKNFIVENNSNGGQALVFGKVNDNKFNLDMSAPLPPLVAFGVALSTFDSRVMCE